MKYKDAILSYLYDLLDYLQSDDYDNTCTGHIEQIENLKEVIKLIEEQ